MQWLHKSRRNKAFHYADGTKGEGQPAPLTVQLGQSSVKRHEGYIKQYHHQLNEKLLWQWRWIRCYDINMMCGNGTKMQFSSRCGALETRAVQIDIPAASHSDICADVGAFPASWDALQSSYHVYTAHFGLFAFIVLWSQISH